MNPDPSSAGGPQNASLALGKRVGAYLIETKIGQGGMGEVYRARDTKLGRDVAIKVLPSAFTTDPARLARLEREARVLASLSHPYIGAIHGLEEYEGGHALVLELVEGETLAERIARGPIPITEALRIARQIAEALESAHDKGIVHRDLKPANIKLAPDDTVKVLDFGLAKIAPAEPSSMTSAAPTVDVTLTSPGLIVGTVAYMSPEQARGQDVDRRADLWAFGCILFEMIAGRRTFEGGTPSEVLARVLEREPDWRAVPASVPVPVRKLLRRTLEKDRRQRLHDAADARLEIEDALAAPARDETPASRWRLSRWSVAMAVVPSLIALGLAVALAYVVASRQAAEVVRLSATIPSDTRFEVSGGSFAAPGGNSGTISPDGRHLLFILAGDDGRQQMWVRDLDSTQARPIAGTDGAINPFWSPDSRVAAFFAGGKLKSIDIASGRIQEITDAPGGRGGDWNADGVIVFAPTNRDPLHRVPASGGPSSPLTELQPGETWHRSPSFLPDGRRFLYRALGASNGIFIGSLDGGPAIRLLDADSTAVYAPPGVVLFVRQTTLFAQRFDPAALRLSGEPLAIATEVATDLVNGLSAFSVSNNGILTYRPGGLRTADFVLTWLSRSGERIGEIARVAPYRGVALSADDQRIAAHIHEGQGGDLWLVDGPRGLMSRLTFDPSQDNASAVWSPDASRIAYTSLRNGRWGIYLRPVPETGQEDLLVESDAPVVATGWSANGTLLYERVDSQTRNDIWMVPLTGDRRAVPLLRTSFRESAGQISPDGRWLLYDSDETGRAEIYVDSWPPGRSKRRISPDGGMFPRWRADGTEVIYLKSSERVFEVMAATVSGSSVPFVAETPVKLFEFPAVTIMHFSPYDPMAVSRDGQRFLVQSRSAEEASTSVTVVMNWPAVLNR